MSDYRDRDESRAILILITSSRANYEVRGWLRDVYNQLPQVEHRFIVGQATSDEPNILSKQIDNEYMTYADLVVGNFQDTYKNLIYKTHAAYQYSEGLSVSFTL